MIQLRHHHTFLSFKFDSKQNLRVRVQKENTAQILPRDKSFRDLSSKYGKEISIKNKKNLEFHAASAKFVFHFFVL